MKTNFKPDRFVLRQIMKFLIVGGTATAIDWVIYYILFHFLKIDPLIANIISYSVSLVYNYLASIKWVFRVDPEKSRAVLLLEFIVLSAIGLLLTEAILWVLIDTASIGEMISKVIATVVVTVFNFISRKIFLEKRKK